MAIRCGLSIEQRPVGIAFPRPKTASGGLRHIPRHRVGRTGPQPTGAPWKNRLRYDLARRGAVLPQNVQPCTGNKSIFASIAEGADTVGDYADYTAIGAAGLGLITAPTGAGGAIFGGTALIAGGVGRLASGVSVLANLADGNWGGAGSSFAGIVGGNIAGKFVGRAASNAYARNRMFNNLSAGQQRRVDLLSDTGSAAGSRAASRAICP